MTRLSPDDLELMIAGEDMDLGTPLMANLHHRRNDTEFFLDRRVDDVPAVLFGQEIRSHFLGHLGLIGIESIFWPWFWGPGYPVYEADDRPNLDALVHSRSQGGVSAYMHPVSRPDPFESEAGLGAIPIMVIPDAVLGDLDTLEVACLWTNEFGTADLWHRFPEPGGAARRLRRDRRDARLPPDHGGGNDAGLRPRAGAVPDRALSGGI